MAIYVSCSGGGGTSSTGTGTSGTFSSGTGPSGGQSGTGETGGTGTNYEPIIVVPNFDTLQQNFIISLGKVGNYFYELHPITQTIIFDYLSINEYELPIKDIVKEALIRLDLNWLKQQTSLNEIIIVDHLAKNNFSTESINFVNQMKNYLIVNTNKTFDDIFYNRTSFDANSATDLDNNTDGGYDTNTYNDFNPQQDPWPNILTVIPVNQFIGFGAQGIRRNCMDYAKAQIAKKGYKISNYGSNGQTFKIYREQTGVNKTELSKGLSYLKYALSNGIPVIVGIDDAPGVPLNSDGTPGNIDLTTDHFIVIVGMGTNSKGMYFQFYDNASGYPSQGANQDNLLYYDPNTGLISGKSQTSYAQTPGLHNYIVTQIRKSKL